MKKQTGIRFYNVIFPVFMIMVLSPMMWLIMIAGNLLIDSLVLWIICRVLHRPSFTQLWKRSIFKVVCFGFLADLLGCALGMFLVMILPVWMNIQDLIPATSETMMALPSVILGGLFVFLLDWKFAFGKTGLNKDERKKAALMLGILTAPYVALIPVAWFL